MIRNLPTTAWDFFVRACEIDDTLPDEGMRLYRRAIQLDPTLDAAMANLGRLYFHRGEYGAAETWWFRALEVNPDHAETNYNLGYLRAEQGVIHSAIEFFKRAITNDDKFADAHFNLAMALCEAGREEEARVHWRRHIQLGGDFAREAMQAMGMRVIEGGLDHRKK